jgi:thiol-disulfide isomerase/thioredoxin
VKLRSTLGLVAAAVLAGVLGVAASAWWHGTASLRASPLGQWLLADAAEGTLAIGDAVPSFALPTLDGGQAVLPVPGRATLVNYWASWCGPCREELPLLLAEAKARGPALSLVPVALDQPGEARRFAREAGLPGPVPVEAPGPADSSVRLGNRAGVLPFSVLIGADGRLQAVRVGNFRDAADLRGWIEAAERAD